MGINSIISCTVVIISCVITVTGEDQCHIKQCMESNTFCKYPTNKKGAECADDYDDTQPFTFKKIILDEHNKGRSEVALGTVKDVYNKPFPTASNMMELEWDERLAELARRWILQCKFEHDECRATEKFKKVGQNIALLKNVAKPKHIEEVLSTMVRNWHLEYTHYDPSESLTYQPSNNADTETGHFTQLNWADTTHVGCAVSAFTKYGMYEHYLFCNYGPAGNALNVDMYQKGKPCKACPKGMDCSEKHEGLCANPSSAPPSKPSWTITVVFSLPLLTK